MSTQRIRRPAQQTAGTRSARTFHYVNRPQHIDEGTNRSEGFRTVLVQPARPKKNLVSESHRGLEQERLHTVPRPNPRSRKTTASAETSCIAIGVPPRNGCIPDKPAPVSIPIATRDDAVRAGIPAGYSIKNWDPTEEPIILLGSVFDAASFGKWTFDWTVYKYRAKSPAAVLAGELWLRLVQLAGKLKVGKGNVLRLTRGQQRDEIYECIDEGQRLWQLLKHLFIHCEHYMLEAARMQGNVTEMGKEAGIAFVDSVFGEQRFLAETQRLITGVREWSMWFDIWCADALKNSSKFEGFHQSV